MDRTKFSQTWNSTNGPAIRNPDPNGPRYIAKPVIKPKSGTRKLTEAEDNARGRAICRRRNKALRGWRPYAQR